MIYIIGDSHCAIFTVPDEKFMCAEYEHIVSLQFSSYRTKPFTAYNLNTKIKQFKEIIKILNIQNNDYIFFSFGEVDIRCHLGFHSPDLITLNNKVEECVNRYIEFLLNFKKEYNNIGVWAPIASGNYNGINGNGRPSYKTMLQRNIITDKFNTLLESACSKHNIIFKSIFKQLINDNNNETYNIYYADGIHLNIKAKSLIINEFKDLI